MIERQLERLAAAGIQLLPLEEFQRHFVLERDGFVSLVERKDGGFGNIGAAGLATPQGLAMLTRRSQDLFFVGRGFEIAATPEQVHALRAFERDLRTALTE
jgi:hypothetical protein